MKRSEIIANHYDDIREAMIEHYRSVVSADGRIQYSIYIWEDGELEYLYGAQGDNSWLKPNDREPRDLFYVCTVSESPAFSIWDHAEEGEPEDEAERETLRETIIDWLVDGYKERVDDELDAIISEAEQEERYKEML